MKEDIEAKPKVLYRPKYVSERKAPGKVAKLVVPLKILIRVVAVILFMLKTTVT